MKNLQSTRPAIIPFIIPVLLATLAGCTMMPSTISAINPNAMPAHQALLLFSIGAENPCKINTTNLQLEKHPRSPDIIHSFGFPMNNGYVKSDLPGPYVKIHSAMVDEGDYYFWINSANIYAYYKDPIITKPFHVGAGEKIYLGEFYIRGCSGDVSVESANEFDRDMTYLQGLNSALDRTTVIQRAPEIAKVERQSPK